MPKMCPYNRAREVQRYKQKNELDESGNISSYAYDERSDRAGGRTGQGPISDRKRLTSGMTWTMTPC